MAKTGVLSVRVPWDEMYRLRRSAKGHGMTLSKFMAHRVESKVKGLHCFHCEPNVTVDCAFQAMQTEEVPATCTGLQPRFEK